MKITVKQLRSLISECLNEQDVDWEAEDAHARKGRMCHMCKKKIATSEMQEHEEFEEADSSFDAGEFSTKDEEDYPFCRCCEHVRDGAEPDYIEQDGSGHCEACEKAHYADKRPTPNFPN